MPQTIQLRPNLFLLPIANQADSSTIQQLLEQTNAVECLNYLRAPNADI